MRARYYSVEDRQFISKDELRGDISDLGSLNRYAYVGGDPVNTVDPSGYTKRFLGENISIHYLENNDYDRHKAWQESYIERLRLEKAGCPIIKGSYVEAVRNAEHYLYARKYVNKGESLYNRYARTIIMIGLTVGYTDAKILGYKKGSPATIDELKAGAYGATDEYYSK